MIPVLSPSAIRRCDERTVKEQAITFEALMERAGEKASQRINQKFPEQKSFIVYCGKGNNGGDGLVIARLLHQQSKKVRVVLVEDTGNESEAFKSNLDRLKSSGIFPEKNTEGKITQPSDEDFIIECIFGNGLNRAPHGKALDTIKSINSYSNTTISIDVPAGLLPDKNTDENYCVQADYTLCFQVPRIAFFFPETGGACGEWELLDIGISNETLRIEQEKIFLIERQDLQHWLKPRDKFSYKNKFGHALLLAGSKGKCGAAQLSGRAAFRAGAGLITIRSPKCCVVALQSALPEAMLSEDEGEIFLEIPLKEANYATIGIGPGIGTEEQTGNVLKRILQDYTGALVLDADAINLLGANKTWLSFMPAETILTPHLGEFRRLTEDYKDPFERFSAQKNFSLRYQCFVVLKGRYSMISCPDGSVLINPTGNPGMATAGAGDVLTGIITGLRAQGMSALSATVCGVWLHGTAGDFAMIEKGEDSMIASDIIEYLPTAFKSIHSE